MVDNTNLTTKGGSPVPDTNNSLTAGKRGPMMLQDVWFLEKLGHFDRGHPRETHARKGLRCVR